jgi:ribosome modulation factor
MNKTLGEISNASAPAFKRGFQDALKTARKDCPYNQPDAIISYNCGFQSGLSAYEDAISATYAQTKHTTK